MKRAVTLCVAVSLVLGSAARATATVTQVLRQELRIHDRLLLDSLADLERQEGDIHSAWVRVERELADLLRAQDQGESLESLRLRDADLRQAEAELMMHISEAQRLRRTIITTRMTIEQTLAEVIRLEGEVGLGEDPLSGTWQMVLEPGGQEGFLSLTLNGTIVQGTYQLSGGWVGSVRGTLVAKKVRLERIDSQIGFAAILYANLVSYAGGARLEGTWEATQLSSGLPSAGTWMAERLDEAIE